MDITLLLKCVTLLKSISISKENTRAMSRLHFNNHDTTEGETCQEASESATVVSALYKSLILKDFILTTYNNSDLMLFGYSSNTFAISKLKLLLRQNHNKH